MASLSQALLARIALRARDPDRRNGTPPTARGQTVRVGQFAVAGLNLASLFSGRAEEAAPDAPLKPPLDESGLASIERRLGFPLPAGLRDLYRTIGDGGFGPAAGILPLEEAAGTYLNLIAHPPGLRGQKWPAHLFPFTAEDPGHVCIDMNNGKIVYWDEEMLADGPSDKVWKRSFKPEAPDLASWFERWLETPSPEDAMKAQMQDAMNSGLKSTLDYWRGKTPAERAEFGLPETGWEETLFGHLGIDLSKL